MDRQSKSNGNAGGGGSSSAQLRKTLNAMFPPEYIQLYHKPPNSVCSLLKTKCWPKVQRSQDTKSTPEEDQRYLLVDEEVSSEPSSRASLASLRENLRLSLVQHQAKAVGLCPIRRRIYEQLFGRFRFKWMITES